ncbi:DUF742 domain-containing protein [Skermania piniformis]|uniref:DUF742 domain-containing protein n=1 Tax=Skermania pinensis TaxID=39122 RepID=A0ABX8S8R6_9ACTN|nr:DUF742 domain-containing protein [Skermania piniformis]QXQ13382.1 DUF742 domain-containing protein [Skermania piniformis]
MTTYNGGGRPEPSMVRPYSFTAGRTRPKVDLAVEALVQSLPESQERRHELSNVEVAIVDMSQKSPSVAEVASWLGMPLGVVRVLVGDLVAAGHVRVHATLQEDSSDADRRDLIERVLSGLRGI